MKKFLVLMLALSLSASAYGAGAPKKAVKPAKEKAAATQKIERNRFDQTIPSDPAVKIGVLDNGLKYYIRENKKPENKAELRIVVKAGSVQEDLDQWGLAHFTEHMCFNGTKNFPHDSLVKYLETVGVRFGIDLNANTWFDRTQYYVILPLDKPGMLETGMQVIEDWAHNVLFDEDELNKERGVITEEWRLGREGARKASENMITFAMTGSKYADRCTIGDTAVIKHAPRQRFVDFYNNWYRPDLMAVIAVGDFNKDEIEKMIKQRFGKLKNPANEHPAGDYKIPGNKEPLVSIYTHKEIQMPQIFNMWKHTPRTDGTYGAYRANIIDRMITQMIMQRLQEKAREAKPLFLGAAAGMNMNDFGVPALYKFDFIAVPKEEDVLGGYEAALTEIFRAYKHGFTKGELEVAKKNTLRSLESALAEKDKTESDDYAEEYFRNFFEGEAMPGIEAENELHKEYVPSITLEEVNKVMKTYITDENMVVIMNAPEKEGFKAPTKEELLASYKKVKNSNIAPYEDFSADRPLMAKKPKAGKVVSKKENKEMGIEEWTLSNGAKVILKPTKFKNDEVLFKAWSLGGTSLASDDMFQSASVASDIVVESGLSDYNVTKLQKMLAGKNASVSPFIGEMTEGMNGGASPKDYETFFQEIYLYFTAPRKDENDFASAMTKMKENLRASKRRPESLLRDSLTAVLYNHHPRKMPTTERDLRKINLDQIHSFYKERFADASDFNFLFVGSIDTKKIQPFIETYIASLPAKNSKESFKDLGVRLVSGDVNKEVKKGVEPKSTVRLVMNGSFDYTADNLLALNSLVQLYNIRLREVIREDKGGVYGIGAGPRMEKFPVPSYQVQIYFGTDPKRVDELIKAVFEVNDELMNAPAKADVVSKVKELMKTEFKTESTEDNSFWLNAIYNSEYNGLDINRFKTYEAKIDAITPETIQAAAKKYLGTKNVLKMVLNPEDDE